MNSNKESCRFDYVKYDEEAINAQAMMKGAFIDIESKLNVALPSSPGGRDAHGRAKALVLTKLEEAYMWVGKAIRDAQIARGVPAPLNEDRSQDAPPPVAEVYQPTRHQAEVTVTIGDEVIKGEMIEAPADPEKTVIVQMPWQGEPDAK